MKIQGSNLSIALSIVAVAAALAGCGRANDASATANSLPDADPAVAETAQLEQKEREIAAREAELALKEREQELARREAELLAKQNAAAKTSAPAPRPRPQTVAAASSPPKAPPVQAQPPIIVPAGTELSIGLSSDLSTRSANVGDPVDARLTSDLVIDGRRAVAAGAPVRGSVTEVVSGSNKIGGVPMLAMTFDRVELEDGRTVPISGRVVQQGKSETAKDTAKIVGGAAAGAIIGHQIDDDKGKMIGGLLGGAAGAVAAKKTGGEVDIPAGTVVVVALEAPVEVSGS